MKHVYVFGQFELEKMLSFKWPHFRFSRDVCIFMLFIRFYRNTVTAMQTFTRSGSNVDVFTSCHVAPIAKLSLQVVTTRKVVKCEPAGSLSSQDIVVS